MLTVLTIISILSGVLLIQLDPIAQFRKAKDARRQEDISQIRLGLDSYYADLDCYPQTLDVLVSGERKYLAKLPADPDGYQYEYRTDEANPCPQWGIVFSKLTGSGATSSTICPVSQLETQSTDCTPGNYSNTWACVISGSINCGVLATKNLPGAPIVAPTQTPIPPTATPIPPTATPTPSPTPANFKYVFVTSQTYNGNLKQAGGSTTTGLQGADNICQSLANGSTALPVLKNKYWKAWLSDSTTDPARRNWWQGEYRLVDGTTIVANNWTDLTDGSLQHAINKDEFGQIQSQDSVWTGTNPGGNSDRSSLESYCADWINGTYAHITYIGVNSYTASGWTFDSLVYCDNRFHLYCFEQDGPTVSRDEDHDRYISIPTITNADVVETLISNNRKFYRLRGEAAGIFNWIDFEDKLGGNDCYDINGNAHPGQTTYFPTNRGDGSFDYDCDGQVTKLITQGCPAGSSVAVYNRVSSSCQYSGTTIGCTNPTSVDISCGQSIGANGAEGCIYIAGEYSNSTCTEGSCHNSTQQCR